MLRDLEDKLEDDEHAFHRCFATSGFVFVPFPELKPAVFKPKPKSKDANSDVIVDDISVNMNDKSGKCTYHI